MECVSHHGRGEKPRPFIKGTPRGDSALRLVTDGGDPLFVENLDGAKGLDPQRVQVFSATA